MQNPSSDIILKIVSRSQMFKRLATLFVLVLGSLLLWSSEETQFAGYILSLITVCYFVFVTFFLWIRGQVLDQNPKVLELLNKR